MECHIDHVHLFIACGPHGVPPISLKTVEGASSLILKDYGLSHTVPVDQELFVATAGVATDIQRYVETCREGPEVYPCIHCAFH